MFKSTLSFVASATLVASLGAETLTIDPIVITATKTEQSVKDTTANVQIITSEDLEERHITTVIDALRTLANAPIVQNGGIGQTNALFLHGFKQGNTLVLIDGIRYNDPTTTEGQAQLEHLMINNIERIELITGAQSGVWGANAVAGVINIITKKPTDKLQVSANAEYGTYATTKLGVSASQKIDALSYYLGVHQLKSNSFSASTPKGENPKNYEADGYLNQTVNAKLFYDITSQDILKTQFNFIDAKTEYDPYNTPNGSGRETSQINRIGNIAYQHKFNANDALDVSYAMTQFNKTDPLGTTKVFKGTNNELAMQGEYHYNDAGFIVTGVNTLTSKDVVTAKELRSKGIFLTNTNRIQNLILTESLRYDTYTLFQDKTTGKLGIKYFFDKDISFSSNYGTAYRVPSLYELYAATYGNPNLLPETTRSLDMTFDFHGLALTYFHNSIDNLVGYNQTTYVNEQAQGTSKIKGYEVRYNKRLTSFVIDTAYTKLMAKNQDGKYLNRRPYESLKTSLTYYPNSKLAIGTTANYIGTRYDDLAQTDQTGRYTLWSAFTNYNLTSNTMLYVKGDNLTDRRYQEASGYGTAGLSLYAGVSTQF